jgi:formylglycine-generating enzyme
LVARRVFTLVLASLALGCPLAASSPSEGKSGPCPAGMAYVTTEGGRTFCIDRWEASTVEVRGTTTVPHPGWEPVEGKTVRAVSRPGVVPQGYISKIEAEGACTNAGKRLCTGDEWLRACRGRTPTTYPYGDERKQGYCNDSGRAPLFSLNPGLGEGVYASHSAMNDPRINQAPNTVAKTGAFSRCKNAFGIYDMVGNLHEWVADTRGSRGTFRGGYYQDTRLNGEGCKYRTVAHAVSYHDYSTGFRCCADPR